MATNGTSAKLDQRKKKRSIEFELFLKSDIQYYGDAIKSNTPNNKSAIKF